MSPPTVNAFARTEAHAGETALADAIDAVERGEATAAPPVGGDRWRTQALLGQGGMGRVYDADDLQFGRRVALKELLHHSGELARRFAIEALVTGYLEHPGIPAVYERGERDGRPYYVMKKLEGRSLQSVIADAKDAEARIALIPSVIKVAHTLGFAHARGIVHRDVKPDNVVVGEHGEVWVVDWGIAKIRGGREIDSPIEALAGAGGTMAGSVMGTPAYMAPEQARGDVGAIDERTDVFALGAMLYHVLSGTAPFGAATSGAALAMAMEARYAPLKQVPVELAAIVSRAMSREPADRFPDAGSMAVALEQYLAHAAAGRPSLVVKATAALASLVALGVALFGTWFTIGASSSLKEQGFTAWLYLFFTFAGGGLSILEWRTRGRHALLPLSIALAAATFVVGLTATFTGLGVAARYTHEHQPPANWGGTMLEGTYEASGNAATSGQLAVVQFMLIAFVERANRLRKA